MFLNQISNFQRKSPEREENRREIADREVQLGSGFEEARRQATKHRQDDKAENVRIFEFAFQNESFKKIFF